MRKSLVYCCFSKRKEAAAAQWFQRHAPVDGVSPPPAKSERAAPSYLLAARTVEHLLRSGGTWLQALQVLQEVPPAQWPPSQLPQATQTAAAALLRSVREAVADPPTCALVAAALEPFADDSSSVDAVGADLIVLWMRGNRAASAFALFSRLTHSQSKKKDKMKRRRSARGLAYALLANASAGQRQELRQLGVLQTLAQLHQQGVLEYDHPTLLLLRGAGAETIPPFATAARWLLAIAGLEEGEEAASSRGLWDAMRRLRPLLSPEEAAVTVRCVVSSLCADERWEALVEGAQRGTLAARHFRLADLEQVMHHLYTIPPSSLRTLRPLLVESAWTCASQSLADASPLHFVERLENYVRGTVLPAPPPPTSYMTALQQAQKQEEMLLTRSVRLMLVRFPCALPQLQPPPSHDVWVEALVKAGDGTIGPLQHLLTTEEAWPADLLVPTPSAAELLQQLGTAAPADMAFVRRQVRWVLRHVSDPCALAQHIHGRVGEIGSPSLADVEVLLMAEGLCFQQLRRLFEQDVQFFHRCVLSAPVSACRRLALRYVQSMARPRLEHIDTSFAALLHGRGAAAPEVEEVRLRLQWGDARPDSLREVGVALPEATEPDLSEWETALKLLTRERLPSRRAAPYVQRYLSAMTASGQVPDEARRAAQAHTTTLDAPLSSLPPTSSSEVLLAKMNALAVAGESTEALQLLHNAMQAAPPLKPYVRREAVHTVLKAARVAGDWVTAFSVLDQLMATTQRKDGAVTARILYRDMAEFLAVCVRAAPVEGLEVWLRGPTGEWVRSLAGGTAASTTERADLHLAYLDAVAQTQSGEGGTWTEALRLLAAGAPPTPRALRSAYSILSHSGRWEGTLALFAWQRRHAKVPFGTHHLRYALQPFPSAQWEAASAVYAGATEAAQRDVASLHHLVSLLVNQRGQWRRAAALVRRQQLSTATVNELFVAASRTVPLAARLRAWQQLQSSLPVSYRHKSAPSYLRLAADLAMTSHGSLSALDVLRASVRGLRTSYQTPSTLVYYAATVHHCWLQAKASSDKSEERRRVWAAKGLAAYNKYKECAAACADDGTGPEAAAATKRQAAQLRRWADTQR